VTGVPARLALALAGWTVVLAGCVAPAFTTSAYESKAGMTAEAAVSAARTALISQDAYLRGRLPTGYLETVLIDAEQTLGSVQDTFDSVQPPDTAAADALRDALVPLLDEANSAVIDLRIAARRDRPADLAAAAGELAAAADDLEAFAREHPA
jgi:hypothetical protein